MKNAKPAIPIDPAEVFRIWGLHRAALKKGGLAPRSLETYQSLWSTWCQHLGVTGLRRWNEAKSDDVRAFLESLNPRALRRGLQHPSSVTQRRYYRVLKEIYQYALAQEWLTANPVDAEASVSPSEQKDALVFHALDWQVMLQALPTPQDPPLQGLSVLAVRDQALLRLMMEAGLTVAELASLDLGDVRHPRLGWTRGSAELWPEATAASASGIVELDIDGLRAAQQRRIVLSAAASVALLGWLHLRATLNVPQRAESPLFVSRKKAGRLTPRALFHVANLFIVKALASRYPDTLLAHAGPMTLRNSCIVRWLDAGIPDDEILARAGLKDLQALLRLRKHVV